MSDSNGDAPLILGGHSFISQLGTDPKADRDQQLALVAACLDRGVRCFDTTYQPERIALGSLLAELGRRDEAEIIAWNFFVDFDDNGEVGGPDAYQPEHIELMLAQLQTDRIENLVVHTVSDEAADRRQIQVAVAWREQGLAGRLGVWAPGADAVERFGRENPFDFMVQPHSVAVADTLPAFAAAKDLGWETLACSPFRRGWRLEALIESAAKQESCGVEALRARLADHMLRYALFAADVDRLIVAMRRPSWVEANVESVSRGPLSEEEFGWLAAIQAATRN